MAWEKALDKYNSYRGGDGGVSVSSAAARVYYRSLFSRRLPVHGPGGGGDGLGEGAGQVQQLSREEQPSRNSPGLSCGNFQQIQVKEICEKHFSTQINISCFDLVYNLIGTFYIKKVYKFYKIWKLK